MRQALLEVMNDLWSFVFGTKDQRPINSRPVESHISTEGVGQIDDKSDVVETVTKPELFEPLGQPGYTLKESDCLSRPQLELDGRAGVLPYATMVTVEVIQNELAKVRSSIVDGWVDKRAITFDPTDIFPQLVSKEVFNDRNPETIKLRRFITDEAQGGRLKLSLQSLEFILFLMKKDGIKYTWPTHEPRIPGMWQKILRGKTKVSLTIEPRTGSILEYGGEEETPFLAYVDAVHPDQTISIQSVGRLKEGQFLHEEFSHEKWKEWRPVFISFG